MWLSPQKKSSGNLRKVSESTNQTDKNTGSKRHIYFLGDGTLTIEVIISHLPYFLNKDKNYASEFYQYATRPGYFFFFSSLWGTSWWTIWDFEKKSLQIVMKKKTHQKGRNFTYANGHYEIKLQVTLKNYK